MLYYRTKKEANNKPMYRGKDEHHPAFQTVVIFHQIPHDEKDVGQRFAFE